MLILTFVFREYGPTRPSRRSVQVYCPCRVATSCPLRTDAYLLCPRQGKASRISFYFHHFGTSFLSVQLHAGISPACKPTNKLIVPAILSCSNRCSPFFLVSEILSLPVVCDKFFLVTGMLSSTLSPN